MLLDTRKSITALAIFLFSGIAGAQAPASPLSFKPDAPDRYVVVPGDTLWGISERFTDSPWRWPELWGFNREQLRNPHRIYPGDVIVLDRASGRLMIGSGADGQGGAGGTGGASGAGAGVTGTGAAGPSGTVKMGPRVRTESLAKQEIPSIPANLIEPFLTRPLAIEPDGLDNAPTIVGTENNRVMVATGNNAYVRGIGNSKEDTWHIYRKGKPLVDPETSKVLAYEAIHLGTARVTRGGDPATVQLTTATQEIGSGDKLVAATAAQPVNYAPHAPATFMQGRVMSIYGGLPAVGEAGRYSIITINRGKTDGLEIGHVVALYRYGGKVRDQSKPKNDPNAMIELPHERYGLAFVFRVFDRVAYALVMNVSAPVNALDVVQTP